MKILILGGSGILSSDFTKKTLDAGCETTIVNRGKRQSFIDPRANLIRADLREESADALREKINRQAYDVVIDFLSYKPQHLEKTLQVVRGNFKQYIFISSATAYRKRSETEIITEETPLGNDLWQYAIDKSLCEAFLRQQDICYTIIRPYVTYGLSRIPFPIIPGEAQYTLLARIKAGKPIALFEDGRAICTLTHARDFAEILYRLLLNERAYGEAFHITSDSRQSWKEVYLKICEILKCEPNSFSVDAGQVQKYLPEFYHLLVGDKGTNMLFDSAKVLNVVGGYNFTIPLEEGLRQSIAFFENTPEMHGINYRWDGRIDYMYKKCVAHPAGHLRCLEENATAKDRQKYLLMSCGPLRTGYDLLRKWKHRKK